MISGAEILEVCIKAFSGYGLRAGSGLFLPGADVTETFLPGIFADITGRNGFWTSERMISIL